MQYDFNAKMNVNAERIFSNRIMSRAQQVIKSTNSGETKKESHMLRLNKDNMWAILQRNVSTIKPQTTQKFFFRKRPTDMQPTNAARSPTLWRKYIASAYRGPAPNKMVNN